MKSDYIHYHKFSEIRKMLDALSEQLAHSAVDLHLKEISEFLHGSEVDKNPTLPWPLQRPQCGSFMQLNVWHRPPAIIFQLRQIAKQGSE